MATPVLDRNADKAEIPVPLSPARELLKIGRNFYGVVARRAYQLYERRGREGGQAVADWVQAEAEVTRPCRHALRQFPGYLLFVVELPGNFAVNQVKVSVEPRRLIVSAEREIMFDYNSRQGSGTKPGHERMFHIQNLPVEIDPAQSQATLGIGGLKVVMPRVRALRLKVEDSPRQTEGQSVPRADSTSSEAMQHIGPE